MAKSFKKLPAAKEEQPKRTSEKDIFDFIEEERTVPSKGSSISEPRQGNINNMGNTFSEPDGSEEGVTSVTKSDQTADEVEVDVRQTFIIGQRYLERLKDYVHTRRVQGQYDYTQKQALHDALDALFDNATIEPRPEYIRKQEDARKQKIRRGIPK